MNVEEALCTFPGLVVVRVPENGKTQEDLRGKFIAAIPFRDDYIGDVSMDIEYLRKGIGDNPQAAIDNLREELRVHPLK